MFKLNTFLTLKTYCVFYIFQYTNEYYFIVEIIKNVVFPKIFSDN